MSCSLPRTKNVGVVELGEIISNSLLFMVFKRVSLPQSMGNCIQKNSRGEFGIGKIKIRVVKHGGGQGENNVGFDQDCANISHNRRENSIGVQSHCEEWENITTHEVHTCRPSNPFLSSENQPHNQRRRPLPTSNLSSLPNYESNRRLLSLPIPSETSPKSEESTLSKLQEKLWSMSSSVACILPVPISKTETLSSPCLKAFTLDMLRKATKNFSEDSLLGEGRFGCVYKGWLDREMLTATRAGWGMPVAIKKLTTSGFEGHKEWLSEVNYLGRIRHPNLVKLIGYCSHGDDRILVYDYSPGGSLENHLFKRNYPTLLWATRMKVAICAARGLCFLHEAESPNIFLDFKTSNILLDADFNAKLSDFGLAKAGPTQGYCDPYYLATGELSIKCDVYSFGVVLLELISGRRVIDRTKFEEEIYLINWTKSRVVENGKVVRIMDTKLEGKYCKTSAYIAANIALRCLNPEPQYRPPMNCILEILENLPSQKKISTQSR